MSRYEVFVLHEGYSNKSCMGISANCTCTLIKGPMNIIVDTMIPWSKNFVLEKLATYGLTPDNIQFVVSTHGHSDHCGNNNLFLEALHVMGFSISHKNIYLKHDFKDKVPYVIDKYVKVIPTPGHTMDHVSVVVTTSKNETVVVAGDLFENENDIGDSTIWKSVGSENEQLQIENRNYVLGFADYIIPGHGKMFKVNKD